MEASDLSGNGLDFPFLLGARSLPFHIPYCLYMKERSGEDLKGSPREGHGLR